MSATDTTTKPRVFQVEYTSDLAFQVESATGPAWYTFVKQVKAERAAERYSVIYENVAAMIDQEARQANTLMTADPHNHPDVVAAREDMEAARERADEAQADIGGVVFCVAKDNLEKAQQKIEHLARRASKIGATPITLTVTNETLLLEYTYAEHEERSYSATFQHVFVIVSGAAPRIPGFEFIAKISHEEAGNIVSRIPAWGYFLRHGAQYTSEEGAAEALDAIDLTRFRTTGKICEHCNTERERNDTYVVYNEQTGEIKQVGRNCLADFTGSSDPERIVKHLEQVWEALRFMGGRGEKPVITTHDFMTHCALVVESDGRYRNQGRTADDAYGNLLDMRSDRRDSKTGEPAYVRPEPRHEARGSQVLAWARQWEDPSDYAHNVRVAAQQEVVTDRTRNIIASAFASKAREEAREEARRQRPTSGHVGTKGQREVFELTVKSIKWIRDDYNSGYSEATKPLFIMEDAQGNSVKWFASNMPEILRSEEWAEEYRRERNVPAPRTRQGPYSLPVVGGTYSVKATVKDHADDERYGKSTIVSRAKFEAVISEPEVNA